MPRTQSTPRRPKPWRRGPVERDVPSRGTCNRAAQGRERVHRAARPSTSRGKPGLVRPMISVQKLVKRYGSGARGRVAVDDVSFEVDKGEVVGFLGPNGAGKSTTLRILAGFLGMTSGKVTVAGHDVREQSFEARQNIGYMPEAVPLYPEMRVAEYLAFRAELKRVPRRDRAGFVDDAMAEGQRRRRRERPHRQPLEGLPAARRPRRCARRASAAPHPRRADGRARPEPDPRGPRRHPRPRQGAHGPPLDAHPERGRGQLQPRRRHREGQARRRGHDG